MRLRVDLSTATSGLDMMQHADAAFAPLVCNLKDQRMIAPLCDQFGCAITSARKEFCRTTKLCHMGVTHSNVSTV